MSLPPFNLRMLVVSLGNPPPLHETFHSAGHMALRALQPLLHPAQPPFTSDRYGKKTTDVSIGPKYSLIISPCVMNTTGPWLSRAWRQALDDIGGDRPAEQQQQQLAMVLVQDELELELGGVRTRDWDSSHKGHNGIRSAQASLGAAAPSAANRTASAAKMWARIRVGIGRPAARDKSSVSDYVLREMSAHQKSLLREQAAPGLLRCLEQLEDQWRRQWEQSIKDRP